MFEYLKPADRPVIDGLEKHEVVFAKHQPEYIPLRTLTSNDRERKVLSRWTLTPEQRQAVANGADVFLELLTFGGPLQPILMAVSNGPNAAYFANRFGLPHPANENPSIPVQFICNGNEKLVTCDPDSTLATIASLLVDGGHLSGDPLAYQFRNRQGVLLENSVKLAKLKDWHFGEGSELRAKGTPDVWRVFVNLPVGIGG